MTALVSDISSLLDFNMQEKIGHLILIRVVILGCVNIWWSSISISKATIPFHSIPSHSIIFYFLKWSQLNKIATDIQNEKATYIQVKTSFFWLNQGSFEKSSNDKFSPQDYESRNFLVSPQCPQIFICHIFSQSLWY